MQRRPLGQTGLTISSLGFGGSSLGGAFGPIDEAEGVLAVREALDLGIDYFDTAPYYGNTRAETVLGRALRDVDRTTYTLATKVGQYGEGAFDFSAPRVTQSLDESLSRLGTDYVDLLQCHDIEFADVDQIVGETLPALHRLKTAGKARHVGITGLPLTILAEVVDRAGDLVETVLSFCRYTLTDHSLLDLLPTLEAAGIGVINAAPTGMGLLTDAGPPDWHPAPASLKRAAREAADRCRDEGWDLASLAISFSVANERIDTTLVGMTTREQVRRNVRSAETAPDPRKLKAVNAALSGVRGNAFTRGLPENRDVLAAPFDAEGSDA